MQLDKLTKSVNYENYDFRQKLRNYILTTISFARGKKMNVLPIPIFSWR